MNRDQYSASGTSEESGWTFYFDDFLASRKRELRPSSSCVSIASITSLVSDAASHVARKSTVKSDLSLKKRKAEGVFFLEDDSLEDTACSTINSPKAVRMEGDDKNVSQINKEEGAHSEECGPDYMKEARECTEMKKRGPCLLPLSIFVDFLA
ncbi:vascular-related unknown protein 4 [Dendrobium catenatum]|uniref:vascular-related unknown protein 4 n=1 Tax=Dendrobium catenatum TaxID=906689 RepID=UPI0009F602FE|nr:vascular-related unknown protein 4 [Dendrobium catenatum]